MGAGSMQRFWWSTPVGSSHLQWALSLTLTLFGIGRSRCFKPSQIDIEMAHDWAAFVFDSPCAGVTFWP